MTKTLEAARRIGDRYIVDGDFSDYHKRIAVNGAATVAEFRLSDFELQSLVLVEEKDSFYVYEPTSTAADDGDAYLRDVNNRVYKKSAGNVQGFITPEQFGAAGDATSPGVGTDDTAAINACIAAAVLQQKPILLTKPYRFAPASAIDLSGYNYGIEFYGLGGKNRVGFILDSGCEFAIEGANSFYKRFQGFRVWGHNDAGAVFRVGKNDFSDAHNGWVIDDMVINNTSTNAAMEGARFNYLLASVINITVNGGGTGRFGAGEGKALVMRQCAFNTFTQYICGQAEVGLSLQDGFNFANNFVSGDIEEVGTSIQISNAETSNNVFSSGQILGVTSINATAGRQNVFGPGCNIVNYSGGSLGSNLAGVSINKGQHNAHLAQPSVPASAAYYKNATGSAATVHVWAGAVSLVSIRSPDTGVIQINPQVSGEGLTVPVPANWEIALTYSSAPSWVWFPA